MYKIVETRKAVGCILAKH